MPDIQSMIGKEVEVLSAGMVYRGTLVEVSDTEIHLKTLLQWISLPTAGVGEIRPAEKRSSSLSDVIAAAPSSDEEIEFLDDEHIEEI